MAVAIGGLRCSANGRAGFPADEWMATASQPRSLRRARRGRRDEDAAPQHPRGCRVGTRPPTASEPDVAWGRVIMGVAARLSRGVRRSAPIDEALVAIAQAWRGESPGLRRPRLSAAGNTMLCKHVPRRSAETRSSPSRQPSTRRVGAHLRRGRAHGGDRERRGTSAADGYSIPMRRASAVTFVPFGSAMQLQAALRSAAFPRATREAVCGRGCPSARAEWGRAASDRAARLGSDARASARASR